MEGLKKDRTVFFLREGRRRRKGEGKEKKGSSFLFRWRREFYRKAVSGFSTPRRPRNPNSSSREQRNFWAPRSAVEKKARRAPPIRERAAQKPQEKEDDVEYLGSLSLLRRRRPKRSFPLPGPPAPRRGVLGSPFLHFAGIHDMKPQLSGGERPQSSGRRHARGVKGGRSRERSLAANFDCFLAAASFGKEHRPLPLSRRPSVLGDSATPLTGAPGHRRLSPVAWSEAATGN